MSVKKLAEELQRLDEAWRACGTDARRAGECQRALADFVSNNLEQIIENLGR